MGIPYLARKGDNEVILKEIENKKLKANDKATKHRNGGDYPDIPYQTERMKERSTQYSKKQSPLVTEARPTK